MKRSTLLVVPAILFPLAMGVAFAAEDAYLGVMLGRLPEAVADHLGVKAGAMVEDVAADSPAAKVGLRRHDVIVNADGQTVAGPEDLKKAIQSRKPGEPLRLKVRRGAESLDIEAVLGEAPARLPELGRKAAPPEARKKAFLGIGVAEVPGVLAVHVGLEKGQGVLVGNVRQDSPAAKAGIEKHDILIAVDGYDVKGPRDFTRLLAERKAGDVAKLDLIQKGARKTVEVTLEERPAGALPWRQFDGFPNIGPSFWGDDGARCPFGCPECSRSGRVILRSPDGTENAFDLPPGLWQMDDLLSDLQNEVGKLGDLVKPEEVEVKVKDFLRELPFEWKGFRGPETELFKADTVPGVSRQAVVRIIDGGYDVTIRERDGARTVTVKKGDQVLLEDRPYKDIGDLPFEARERVEKAAATIEESAPAPKVEEKIRA
jgi:membrane-associated protease RseP (regulator of RpoE activity)